MKKCLLLIFMICISSLQAEGIKLKPAIVVSMAMSETCKIYAGEVGGDAEAFSRVNILILKTAEKLGYTDDLESFVSDVKSIQEFFLKKLIQKYGDKSNVYNNWCIPFYKGIQKKFKYLKEIKTVAY